MKRLKQVNLRYCLVYFEVIAEGIWHYFVYMKVGTYLSFSVPKIAARYSAMVVSAYLTVIIRTF